MRDAKELLDERNVQVLTITFGTLKQAERWVEETSSPFPMLLDPERNVYRDYGLRSSILKVYSLKMVLVYFKLLRQGRKLRPVQGDPHQLGGDFLIDSVGRVLFAHPSEDPSDRPSVETILGVLNRDAEDRRSTA